jgi:hypothetical protein
LVEITINQNKGSHASVLFLLFVDSNLSFLTQTTIIYSGTISFNLLSVCIFALLLLRLAWRASRILYPLCLCVSFIRSFLAVDSLTSVRQHGTVAILMVDPSSFLD